MLVKSLSEFTFKTLTHPVMSEDSSNQAASDTPKRAKPKAVRRLNFEQCSASNSASDNAIAEGPVRRRSIWHLFEIFTTQILFKYLGAGINVAYDRMLDDELIGIDRAADLAQLHRFRGCSQDFCHRLTAHFIGLKPFVGLPSTGKCFDC